MSSQQKTSSSQSTNVAFSRIDFYDLLRKAITPPVPKPAPKAK